MGRYVSKLELTKENRCIFIQQLYQICYNQSLKNFPPAHGGNLEDRKRFWEKEKKIQWVSKSWIINRKQVRKLLSWVQKDIGHWETTGKEDEWPYSRRLDGGKAENLREERVQRVWISSPALIN